MGIIVNQSVKGTIYIYIGVILGFIIQGILFPDILTTEQIGLTKVIVVYATLVAQFATLGFNGVTIRLFPFFRDSKSRHHGFLSLAMLTGLVGFLIFIGLYLIFNDWYIAFSSGNSDLLLGYLNYLIALIFFQIYFTLFDGYYTALLNSIHGTFLREIFQRVLMIIGIGLYYFGLIGFHQFIILYMVSMALPTLVILFTLIREGEFSFKTDFAFLQRPLLTSMGLMAFFSILTGFSVSIITAIDTIMITGMIGLGATGIYSTCMIFGTMVSLPSRSILKITNVVSARAWKINDLDAIRNIYEKSCITLFIIGLLMFLGLWVNIDNVFAILGPAFLPGKWVIFFIGFGSLIDMSTGANSSILGSSKYYKVQTMFLILLVFLLILTNYLLIPLMGITGAAMGSALSLTILNLLRFLYLWYKFGLQPFNSKFVLVAGIGLTAWIIAYMVPVFPYLIADIIVRSSVLTLLFCLPVYLLKISPDINEKADEIIRAVKKLRS